MCYGNVHMQDMVVNFYLAKDHQRTLQKVVHKGNCYMLSFTYNDNDISQAQGTHLHDLFI